MPALCHRYYFPWNEGLDALRRAGCHKEQRRFFVAYEEGASRLNVHIGRGHIVTLTQQGTLSPCMTHDVLEENFQIYLQFMSDSLACWSSFEHMRKGHICLIDRCILENVPYLEFLKTCPLGTRCRSPNVLRCYMSEGKAEELTTYIETFYLHTSLPLTWGEAMQKMKRMGISNISLLCLWGFDQTADQMVYTSFAHVLHCYHDLALDDPASFFDFMCENADRSRKLYREANVLETDLGVLTCEDGTRVYNFHDPDCFHKFIYDEATPLSVTDLEIKQVPVEEFFRNPLVGMKARDKIPRKRHSLDLPTIATPPPLSKDARSFRKSIFTEIKESIFPVDFTSLQCRFHRNFLATLHKLWRFRRKSLDILVQFRSGLQPFLDTTRSDPHDLRHVKQEAFMEAVSLAHHVDRVCRSLETVPVRPTVVAKYTPAA